MAGKNGWCAILNIGDSMIRQVIVLGIFVLFMGCVTQPNLPVTDARNPSTAQCHWRISLSGAYLPDSACTPGAIFENASSSEICVSGYSSTVRNVPDSLKNKVYALYGITNRSSGEYEIDHLISLQLGGSNDISNLWPEPATPKPGFHEKDGVENSLKSKMCKNESTLKDTQALIATDWTRALPQQPSTSASDNPEGEP